jgi:hypothetical protein
MSANISCPVSDIKVNENKVRIVALLVFLAGISYLIAPNWVVPAVLTIDFFLRGFGKGQYSLFAIVGGWVVHTLSIPKKPIDQVPKVFAARLGFGMCLFLTLATLLSLTVAGVVIASILVLFSFLESALAFCAGCYVYTFLYYFSNK